MIAFKQISKNSKIIPLICALVTISLTLHQLDGSTFKEFCWKDSYGRGIGTVPKNCAADQERIGLLCYQKCPQGMKRFGFDCHSVCPSDMRNDGLFCRKVQYGRGSGYAWKFSDGFSSSGMRKRCQARNGVGNCEKWGAIYYPKCKPGYRNVACCICRPSKPNCGALGLGGGFDLSCAKKIKVGNPKIGICNTGQDRDAGLCYKSCRSGYKGVGPVCWGKAPSGWVQCGMGAAKSKFICGSTIFNQVSSVGQLAFTVATAGAGAAANQAATASQKAKQLSALRQKYQQLKALYEANKDAIKAAGVASKVVTAGSTEVKLLAGDKVTAQDIARLAAQIAAIADPSGVSATIAAYTYPKCDKYFE